MAVNLQPHTCRTYHHYHFDDRLHDAGSRCRRMHLLVRYHQVVWCDPMVQWVDHLVSPLIFSLSETWDHTWDHAYQRASFQSETKDNFNRLNWDTHPPNECNRLTMHGVAKG